MWHCSKASGMKVLTVIVFTPIVKCFFSFEAELNYFCAGSSLEDSVVRWCCISHAEQKKCEQWALSVKSDPLVCVRAVSFRDCIRKIKVNPYSNLKIQNGWIF